MVLLCVRARSFGHTTVDRMRGKQLVPKKGLSLSGLQVVGSESRYLFGFQGREVLC